MEASGTLKSQSRPFDRVSFSRQFLLVCAAVLLAGMLVLGNWLSRQIERNAVNRTAAIAAVYVESMLVAQIGSWHGTSPVDAATQAALDQLFVHGPLRRKVLRFKLWTRDGAIAYSSDAMQTGLSFAVDGLLAAAFRGSVQSRISDLEDADNLREQLRWPQLLEVYVPLRRPADAEIVGVAEFYHSTENLGREVHEAQRQSWLLVAATTLAMYILLHGLARRADRTIQEQQRDLHEQLHQLRIFLDENRRMREKLHAAGANTTALNEQFLRRIAADLHDGPAQAIALVNMRFDELVEACGEAATKDLGMARDALKSALHELRGIASGLILPGIAELSTAETVRRVVQDFERNAKRPVELQLVGDLGQAPLAVKITLFRVLQESLTNCRKHADSERVDVRVSEHDNCIITEIADHGTGFDPADSDTGHLGLALMRERVLLLGGTFELDAAPGKGTAIRVRLPLSSEVPAHE